MATDNVPAGPHGRRASLRSGVALALLVWAMVLHVVEFGYGIWGDGYVRAETVKQLVDQRTLYPGTYSLMGPIFSAPLHVLDGVFGTGDAFLGAYNSLLFLVFGLAFVAALWRPWGPRRAVAFLAALFAGTTLPFAARTFYGELFSVLTIGLGLHLVGQRLYLAGWALVVLGTVNTPALLVGCGLVAALEAYQSRRLRHLAVPMIVFGLFCLENWLRRGHLLDTGYEGQGVGPPGVMPLDGKGSWSTPLLIGVLGLLFSFGRGVLYFVPGLWLAPLRRAPSALSPSLLRWLLFGFGAMLVFAKWFAWHGASWHGPRFLMIAYLPASALLVWHLHDEQQGLGANLLTLAVLGWSCWVAIGAETLNYFTIIERESPALSLQGGASYYSLEFSALFYPFVRESNHISFEGAGYIASVLLIAAWLAAGAVKRTTRQVVAELRGFWAAAPFTGWRA